MKGVKEMRSSLGPKGRGGYGGAEAPAAPKAGVRNPQENYVAGRTEAPKAPPGLPEVNASVQPSGQIGVPQRAAPPSREQLEARKAAVAAVLSGQADSMIANLMGGAKAPASAGGAPGPGMSSDADLRGAAPVASPAPQAAPPAVRSEDVIDPEREAKLMAELYKIYGLRQ